MLYIYNNRHWNDRKIEIYGRTNKQDQYEKFSEKISDLSCLVTALKTKKLEIVSKSIWLKLKSIM